ncbi:hypothetical protein DC31_06390 [Microbacterium sp. CH12i]|uniref:hypothetical protein n=1 Tax=Microbacterium sp. CH12i TaxID=1479651 RepID=UPI000460D1AC|nr:hypothetical protein [Microbacterium sp. CH12i]KDA04612.1 hypothetical protein DC31_06390 [Microbacterium sp. CH12i]
MQRFAWQIAQRFFLSSGPLPRQGVPLQPGILRNGRHIGNLIQILERYNVTPDRYTPQSLNDALQVLIAARKLPSPNPDQQRDKIAFFAWTLKRLNELAVGETTIERIRRESAERARQREEGQHSSESSPPLSETDREAAHTAAAAFFAQNRQLRRPKLRERRTDVKALVRAALGSSIELHAAHRELQTAIGELTTLNKALTAAGWTLQATATSLRWSNTADGLIEIQIQRTDTSTSFVATTPPEQLDPSMMPYMNPFLRLV